MLDWFKRSTDKTGTKAYMKTCDPDKALLLAQAASPSFLRTQPSAPSADTSRGTLIDQDDARFGVEASRPFVGESRLSTTQTNIA